MRTRGNSRAVMAAVVVGVLTTAVTGCSGAAQGTPGDKAGGSSPTVSLTLGTVDPQGRPDTPTVEYFASRVTELTAGSVTVDVHWGAAKEDTTDFEAPIVRAVQSGDLDLGWIGSRAFDTVGVTSLQAIQAPFLITDNRVTAKVAAGPVATTMLAGLASAGLVGLGLYPDQLRHPVGFHGPFVGMADFKGARIRTPTSNASDALLRSLGAEPMHLNGRDYGKMVDAGALDGVDSSLGLAPALSGSIATGNVTFYPRMNVLFASPGALDELDGRQRSALARAARDTLQKAVSTLPEQEDTSAFCEGGGVVVTAPDGQLKAMRQAAQQVYAELEQDSTTKAAIAAIRGLVDQVGTAPASAACGTVKPTSPTADKALVPDGVYTAVGTKADALRLGSADPCALKADGAHFRIHLKDGWYTQWEKCSLMSDQIGSKGRFSVTSDTFTTTESCCGDTFFDWSFDGRYLTLKMRALPNGAQPEPAGLFVWDHRWTKVG